jgi:tripartite-type tricarboxylate transporter receptor subunit TctC
MVSELRQHDLMGQCIVIENVGGADGSIGLGRAARARRDGYTICLSIMDAYVLNGAFYSLAYDLITSWRNEYLMRGSRHCGTSESGEM